MGIEVDAASLTWMFQYNPAWYNLASNIAEEGNLDHWPAIQNRRWMRNGSRVYILRAGGREGGSSARLEALAHLCSSVYSDESDNDPYKVWVEYLAWIDPPLTRDEMRRDNVINTFHALAVGRTGTNFLLPREVAKRIDELTIDRLRPIASHDVVSIAPSAERPDAPKPHVPSILGQTYRIANDQIALSERAPVLIDPERIARANRCHAELQNRLAHVLVRSGVIPLSPRSGGPNFDLAWVYAGWIYVAEVKSLTPENEETQLRLGMAQVLMYRHLLAQHEPHIQAVLYIEREPSNPTWLDLCSELNIILIWPDTMEHAISAAHAAQRG